jgi:AraC family transcriptional activator of mtrCDE
MSEHQKLEASSILDRYLANLSVEVDPFALCMLQFGWRLTLPGPPCAMLHFVVQGNGWLSCPDGTHTALGPNWLIVIPAGTIHSLETPEHFEHELKIPCTPTGPPVHHIVAGEPPAEMVVGCGTLNVRYGESMGLFDHLSEVLVVDLSAVPEVPGLYQSLIREQSNGAPGTPVLQGAIMTQLLVHMLRVLSAQSDTNLSWLNALSDPRLGKAIDLILDDPAAAHSVESLADSVNMSRSAFAKHFQDAFFRSPMKLVSQVRLERAARMLSGSTVPVERVARHCGFSSRSHFSKAFKKHTGLSPAEFRSPH